MASLPTKDARILNFAMDPCIPVRRQDGSRTKIGAWEITKDFGTNPVIAVDAPRAPLNGALTGYLSIFLQTILFPEDARVWREHWNDPPDPEYLRKEFSKVAPLFELDGDRPFMQDRSLLADPKEQKEYTKPIQKLLIDGVAELQVKHHSDIFLKNGAIAVLCPACAAAILWDLQAHAPQGGSGYNTSLRGGGPLSTMILCKTLWHTVWANVVEQSFFGMKGRPDPATFLPWMEPLRQRLVKPAEENPLHVLWGMPRRVLLKFSGEPGNCDICGMASASPVRTFLTCQKGLQYAETDWRHPLSPYVRRKDSWQVHPTESDIVGHRHWMGLIVDTPKGDGMPSYVVRRWLERDVPNEPYLRLWCFGYKANQAAISLWCEGMMPVVTVANGLHKEYESTVRTLVALSQRGYEKLSTALEGAIKMSSSAIPEGSLDAFQSFWRQADPERVSEYVRKKAEDLWRRLDPAFFGRISALAAEPSKDAFERASDEWVTFVQTAAVSLYDEALPVERIEPAWAARFFHRLRRELSGRNPATLKTRRFGDWRITDA